MQSLRRSEPESPRISREDPKKIRKMSKALGFKTKYPTNDSLNFVGLPIFVGSQAAITSYTILPEIYQQTLSKMSAFQHQVDIDENTRGLNRCFDTIHRTKKSKGYVPWRADPSGKCLNCSSKRDPSTCFYLVTPKWVVLKEPTAEDISEQQRLNALRDEKLGLLGPDDQFPWEIGTITEEEGEEEGDS